MTEQTIQQHANNYLVAIRLWRLQQDITKLYNNGHPKTKAAANKVKTLAKEYFALKEKANKIIETTGF